MPSLPLKNERACDLLVAYSLSSGEEMGEAVVNAFCAANIDVFEKPTTLDKWINTDVFEALQWTDRPVYLNTRIWDCWVRMSAEEIRIYR